MKKKFITNLILLLSLNLLVKPFWILGIDRTVQNVVGAEEYGFYYAALNLSFLFNILLDLGITNYNNRNISQHSQLLNKHFSSIVIVKFMLSVLYAVFTLGIGFIIGYSERQILLLLVLVFNQFLSSFILYLRSNIAGLLLFKIDSILSVLDRFLMIIICSFLLWTNISNQIFQIEWLAYIQTIAYSITAIVALVLVIIKSKFRKLRWNRPFFIMVLKQSFPFALLILLMNFYQRIDSVMLERMLADGKEQAGIYASAYRLLDAVNMIAYLFAVLLLPIFSRMIKLKESIEEIAKISFNLIIVMSVVCVGISCFYSYEIMDLMYIEHVNQSSDVFQLLMSTFVAIGTVYIFGKC